MDVLEYGLADECAYEYIDQYVRAHASARANVHVYTIIFQRMN